MTTPTVSCGECGTLLDEDAGLVVKPPCPHCASTKRSIAKEFAGTVHVSGELSLVRVREYLQDHPFWLLVSVVLAVGGAAVGTWLFSGWLAFVVSLALAAVGFGVGLLAVTRVVERETR